MTVEQEVANLTTSVDSLTEAVNVKKATLDASVTDSEAARDQSQTARDTAENHKLAAEAAATSATNTAASLTGFDLDAIAASKGVTAVAVFVYDTSKDSDGGAWRQRCQHTSWYNETLNTATRGSRREFPSVAVIVAEADKVTIYDGDDPALPMWMVISGGSDKFFNTASSGAVTAVSMRNGWIVGTSSTRGYSRLNFISEEAYIGVSTATYKVTAPIAVFRNATVFPTYTVTGSLFSIVNIIVNDVAMTVLPDAPIDPATGLPVPTIAVATDGGTSVITDSGAVYDSSATAKHEFLSFVGEGLWFGHDTGMQFATYEDIAAGDGFGDLRASSSSYTPIRAKLITRARTDFIAFENDFAVCGGLAPIGLQRSNINYDVFGSTMNAFITSSYNTGWMNGDIKLAALSDTDDTDLVGIGELVTNGTFDSDVSGWDSVNATLSHQTDRARATADSDGFSSGQYILSGLTGGDLLYITAEITAQTGSYAVRVYTSQTAGVAGPFVANLGIGVGVHSGYVRVPDGQTGLSIHISDTSALAGEYVEFDNVSVKLADEDRSVNNNGLVINGTITREPVASGADLVAYSGFSASNYLEQPYNPDLDFGTGDFCVMGWVKGDGSDGILIMRDSATTAQNIFIRLLSGAVQCRIDDDSTSKAFSGGSGLNNNTWVFVSLVKVGDNAYIYVNGNLAHTEDVSAMGSLDNPNAVLTIGNNVGKTNAWGGSLALWRISATAPTAEQIAKIYEDEKVLFQENAQATLYGTSDAVTALAHDPVTDLLHVSTSDGRSDFHGLRRVSNTTDSHTSLSASGGMIVGGS